MLRPVVAPLRISDGNATWWRPATLDQLLHIKALHNHARIVAGNTEVGIEAKFKGMHFRDLVSPGLISELHVFESSGEGVTIGASVTLTDLATHLKRLKEVLPEWKCRGIGAILYQLQWFAGSQIRNVASIGGNIATASPISDLNPIWIALGSTLELASLKNGRRTISMSDFFLAYRKTALHPDEVIIALKFPLPQKKGEFVRAFKQARRKEDDIAIVSACFRILISEDAGLVSDACLVFGGMAARTIRAERTEKSLIGKRFLEDATFEAALIELQQDVPLPINAVGGMAAFRCTLTASFFFKFFQFVMSEIDPTNVNLRKDAFVEPHFGVASGTQMYGPEKKEMYPVSYPIPHLSAAKQVAGEAQYVDDIPNPARGLFAHFVMSSKACATFSGIDAETALKMPGVVAFFSAADIPGVNEIGPVFYGEELFAEKKVEFVGHPVGIIVAESAAQARDAANQVRINWGEERKPILSIEDAIAAKSFLWDTPRFIEKGDVESAFAKSANIVEGEVNVGAQEHFYLEPQGSIANVTDNDEIEIWASTQNPTKTQMKVAAILKLPAGKVITRTKRMGGGFGGKETRSIYVSAACAVAAFKLRRPVRMILDRDVDFATSGARHAFRGNYKIGFDKSGVIEGVDVQLFSNAGYSMDLSFSVMERALFHSLNAYKCPNVRVVGNLCKTNLLSATAFRGFGAPQGMMVVESWMDHIARKLNLAPEVVRMRNFISAGDLTHFNQIVDPTICIGEMYASLMKSCDYENRRKEVARFNAENKYRKRGLSLIPTVFGMSFTAKFMNQAGALVHCYLDGSIQVHHGGTEMGQGLHTKIAQVAAHAFGIELSQVSVIETATDKVSNTSPTAASVSSDINGAAVLDACKQINERLDPLRKEFPEATFAQLCQKAHLQRINLSANGFYRTPDLKEFNFLHRVKEGDVNQPFNYFSQGCACSEVELDTLTGDHTVIRSDIIMDVGNSINPAIDVGQIEGAFVQVFFGEFCFFNFFLIIKFIRDKGGARWRSWFGRATEPCLLADREPTKFPASPTFQSSLTFRFSETFTETSAQFTAARESESRLFFSALPFYLR